MGVALAVGAFFIVRALAGDDNEGGTLESRSAGLSLHYPKGWKPVSKEELARLPGSPVAVIRREDRKGILIIDRQRRVTRDLDKLSRQLDRELKKRIPDFQKVSSQSVNIKAGQAFLYSYVRKHRGTVHTVVAVPARSGGYTINATVPAGAEDAAREVGAMIRSFDD